MTDRVIQASFNSGEWSPKLFARVDMQKYRSGAALLLNFFVDYRGGASTRPGTKYTLQCFKSATAVRLIPFQASFSVGYVLEFGDTYVRFFFDGAPILETATSITNATAGPPELFTDNAHGYSNGDWIFVQGNYYIVAGVTTNTFTLTDLFGNAINTNPFTLPASAQRVYTIASPYAASELNLLKFTQNVNEMVICHPNHPPYVLTLVTASNWTLVPIVIGSTIAAPTGVAVTTTLTGSTVNYAYVVTSVDVNGQESGPSAFGTVTGLDIRTNAGTNVVSWAAVAAAASYNIYRAEISYAGPVPAAAVFGFSGNTNSGGTSFIDSNIAPDFATTPPVPQNPFSGSGVRSVTVTSPGNINNLGVPTVSFSGGGGSGAAANAIGSVQSITSIGFGGGGFAIGDLVFFPNGVVLQVTGVTGGFAISSVTIITGGGANTGQATPSNIGALSTNGHGTLPVTVNVVWGIASVGLTSPGTGYATPPAVAFSAGTATAISTLGAPSSGNPTVPGFFQQRLVLAGPVSSPQQINMSKTAQQFNFDVSLIAEPTDAIQATLVSGQLGSIKAMVSQTTGLLVFTDRNSWLINGGTPGSAVGPASFVANAQSFNGVSDVPPIISNFDVLYVQSKGSIIRDSSYNIYANVYTGTDISVISSHLFYGFTIKEWAWAEEPYKVVWAIRNDGVMLTLTFLKEQEFIGWAHSTTQGTFQSVATVIENTSTAGEVDAVYTVVQRTVQGQSLKYIERIVERTFPNGVVDAWCVDCGIQYIGTPVTTFSGAQFLAGLTVTGLADGKVITPFVMPSTGTFTLGTAASKVTIGLPFTAQLQTLPLDLGEPTVQGKPKKISDVVVRVAETLGLSIGQDFNSLVPMKDLIQGNVSSMLTGQASQIVTDLVNGDARTILGPAYTIPGQYCIQQSLPVPATILGVFPSITVGDPGGRGQ